MKYHIGQWVELKDGEIVEIKSYNKKVNNYCVGGFNCPTFIIHAQFIKGPYFKYGMECLSTFEDIPGAGECTEKEIFIASDFTRQYPYLTMLWGEYQMKGISNLDVNCRKHIRPVQEEKEELSLESLDKRVRRLECLK